MSPEFWETRYGEDGFAYGTDPNEYLKQNVNILGSPAGTCVVELGSGEGRNAVWLAKQGFQVVAVDLSKAGVEKTRQLAREAGVSQLVEAIAADATEWMPAGGAATVDAVVLTYFHVPPLRRLPALRNVKSMLKPGGVVVCEAFTVEQLRGGFSSGGPPAEAPMYSLDILRQAFGSDGGAELAAYECVVSLSEGKYHRGDGAVVRYIWRKST